MNIQTISALRQKVHHLEIELAKALRESKLLESLQQIEEGNVPAASLMNFLSFIFQVRPQLNEQYFTYLKELFDGAQYRLIEAYETRIGSLNQMNTALITQLKEQNYEL